MAGGSTVEAAGVGREETLCVWGNDDCGMERDFDLEGDALHIFYHIISWTYVNKDQLKNAGFVFA